MKTASKVLFVITSLFFLNACVRHEVKTLSLKETKQPIVIDAEIESSWDVCEWEPVPNVRFSRTSIVEPKDLEANFKGLWDSEYLYFLIKVEDDKRFVVYAESEIERVYDLRIRELDGIELYFDNGLKEQKENTVSYFRLTYGADTISLQGRDITTLGSFSEIKSSYKEYDMGYIYECKIPWNSLGIHPSQDKSIRFELNVIDNDGETIMPGALAKKRNIKTWADKTKTNPALDNSIYGRLIFDKN